MSLYFELAVIMLPGRHGERAVERNEPGLWIFTGVFGFVIGVGIAFLGCRSRRAKHVSDDAA
jgi:hypothetical protein